MNENPILTLEIQNDQPVELVDLVSSFSGFGDEYKSFIINQNRELLFPNTKLYIKEIRPGSIVADFMTLGLPTALAFMEHADNIIKFSIYLKTACDFLLGKIKENPIVKKISYQNLSNFVNPIAKDNASQMNCNTTINGDVNLVFNITSNDANAIQNRAQKEMDLLKEPVTGIKEKMLLYWYQARNDPKSQVGDKAIIENIQDGPVKTIFLNDSVKAKMLYDLENPFKSAYVVDVEVETIHEKPAIYKVLTVYERFDKPIDSDRQVTLLIE